jgi:hypothetical protein
MRRPLLLPESAELCIVYFQTLVKPSVIALPSDDNTGSADWQLRAWSVLWFTLPPCSTETTSVRARDSKTAPEGAAVYLNIRANLLRLCAIS